MKIYEIYFVEDENQTLNQFLKFITSKFDVHHVYKLYKKENSYKILLKAKKRATHHPLGRKKIKLPNADKLSNQVEQTSVSAVARKYGVSRGTILNRINEKKES